MKIKLSGEAIMPTRAHPQTLDSTSMQRKHRSYPLKNLRYLTREFTSSCRKNTVGFIKSKSGLNVNHDIVSEGVIDVGYTGSIRVKLYNHGGYDYKVNKGDKISQLVILPILTPDLELVDELESTERGEGGFGSTGK